MAVVHYFSGTTIEKNPYPVKFMLEALDERGYQSAIWVDKISSSVISLNASAAECETAFEGML